MIVVWLTLIFLHRGYSLVPVKTVQLGEAVTLSCDLPIKEFGTRIIYWYKQSVGDGLKLIVTQSKSATPEYSPEFSRTRFDAQKHENFSNLTIMNTVQGDEGLYHCGIAEWMYPIQWSETYLLVKGNTQRTSAYTVLQWPTVSDPLHAGESVTLQCSVLSDSNSETCPGGHSVFLFREGLQTPHPSIIYTDGNKHHECENRSEAQQRCVYRFSKNISSSDAGTYYCAVAACGEILFGNGTKLDIQGDCMWSQSPRSVIFLLCAVLAVSLIVIAVLICPIKKNNNDHYKAPVVKKNFNDQKKQQNKDTWMFSAAVFTLMKADRGVLKDGTTVERQQIYTACKALGLD
ncbi:signal-regulatory protein beta-2-like [Archocentrus centrarchus]|uniref:signal-regulatory protein beta-2-like n=1 Tax=Archocentrus centrarchus TaxID=63155 RepID=UPI0011EA0E71|nr:signal-regulatory protein beta-2-like [Archocentrus centrarchus]